MSRNKHKKDDATNNVPEIVEGEGKDMKEKKGFFKAVGEVAGKTVKAVTSFATSTPGKITLTAVAIGGAVKAGYELGKNGSKPAIETSTEDDFMEVTPETSETSEE